MLTCCFLPLRNPITKLWQIAKCTSAACSHKCRTLSLSRWTRWTQMRLLPARRFVSAVLPCATNLAEHESPIPGQTQGVSCAASDSPGCKRFTVSSPASCCCSQACPPSKIIITPKTCYLCRMMSQHMRKAAVLIGGRTKTAQSEHELMKGRIFCPRVFCLSPSWETGYTVFCQHAVSGNYGLHCCLGAQSLCLLTWCSTVLDTKHKCLARASRKYYGYARGSTHHLCRNSKHTSA